MVFEIVEVLKIFPRFSKVEKVIVDLKVASYLHVEFGKPLINKELCNYKRSTKTTVNEKCFTGKQENYQVPTKSIEKSVVEN